MKSKKWSRDTVVTINVTINTIRIVELRLVEM